MKIWFLILFDFQTGNIHRINVNGSTKELFAPSATVGAPNALALDWLSRNLYYTNPKGR